MDLDLHNLLEDKLSRYNKLLSFYLCHCRGTSLFSGSGFPISFLRSHNIDNCSFRKNHHNRHHMGHLLNILSKGPKLKEKHIDNWVGDLEHGFLHSYIVGFIAFLYKYPDGLDDDVFKLVFTDNDDNERLMLSCLLHDFLKCQGHKQEGHDSQLIKQFPNLLENVYSHSYPEDDCHPLIVGDRIELMRFSDYQEWVEEDMVSKYFDKNFSNYFEHFYRYIRPVISKVFTGRFGQWLRHGPEHMEKHYCPDSIYPKRYMAQGEPHVRPSMRDYWPIEVGNLPFRTCIQHKNTFTPWGLITLDDYKNKCSSPDIIHVLTRDHLAAHGHIKLQDWVFAIPNNNFDYREDKLNLIKNSGGFMSINLINNIHETTDHFLTMFKVLRRL